MGPETQSPGGLDKDTLVRELMMGISVSITQSQESLACVLGIRPAKESDMILALFSASSSGVLLRYCG